jgi:hypothetical protein
MRKMAPNLTRLGHQRVFPIFITTALYMLFVTATRSIELLVVSMLHIFISRKEISKGKRKRPYV